MWSVNLISIYSSKGNQNGQNKTFDYRRIDGVALV